jgi:ABC-type lipoprotein release transport system permease subunit
MVRVGVAWLRLRAEVRRHGSSWLVIAVLAGLIWGGALVALTGARRTETAYDRFLGATSRFDMLVTNGSTPDTINKQFELDEVARLPQVTDSALIDYYLPSGRTRDGDPLSNSSITPFAPTDGRFGRDLNRAKVLHGRMPTGARELALSFVAADQLGLHVGDTMPLSLAGMSSITGGAEPPEPSPYRVVGVVAIQGAFPPLSAAGSLPPMVLLSHAYARAHPDAAQGLTVRLRHGRADVPAFSRELQRMAKGTQVIVLSEEEQTTTVQRGLDVQATVLRLLAAVLAVIALVITTQALSRRAFAEAGDDAVLRALGLTGGQRRSLSLARTALVAVGTPLAAVAIAIALSPFTPVGVARKAEPHPGFAVNVAELAIGAAAIAVVVFVVGALAARWAIRSARDASPARPSRVVGALARSGAPPTAVSGVRMALEPGRGPSAVPVRSTVLGAAIGIIAITGVLVFTGSIGRLFDHPALYGWNWDVQVGSAFTPDLAGAARTIGKDPAVSEVALGAQSRLQLGGIAVDTLGIDRRSAIRPTVVAGRPAAAPGEILVGTRTLRELHLDVGDAVPVVLAGHTVRLRIVGRGVLNEFATGARLGEGAAMTLDGLRHLVPETPRNIVLIRVRAGADRDAFVHKLQAAYLDDGVFLPEAPSDLSNLESLRGLPFVVAGLLGVVALATLGNTLATSVRRRRRDLSVLKVLGFVRGQVRTTAAWQSATLVVLACAIGIPLGVVAGRFAWSAFADRLGVSPRSTVPVLTVTLLVPVLLILGGLIATVPGRLAARTRPANGLRAE